MGEMVEAAQKAPRKNARRDITQTDEGRELNRTALMEIMTEFQQPKVMSDNQLRERFMSYFARCAESGQVPTVEECLLSTGYSVSHMQQIAKGKVRGKYFTPEAPEIIRRAIEIIQAWDAKMVMQGKLPQIPYIFRAKNFYGMTDKPEGEEVEAEEEETPLNLDDIRKRYALETSFTDAESAERS